MRRASFASVLLSVVMPVAGSLLVACGGAPPRVAAVDGQPLAIVPRAAAEAPLPAAPATRPDKTAVWMHLDDPAMLVLMLSTLKDKGSAAGLPVDDVTAYLDTIDLGRPIDAAISLHKKKDVDAAVRLSFRDSKAFFKLLATRFTLREEGDRIRIAKKDGGSDLDAKPDDENANDVVVCEFEAPARTSDTAICGTAHGVELFRDWLRTSPKPVESKTSRASLVQAVVYAAPLRKLAQRELADMSADKADDAEELRHFAEDAESVTFELAREGLSIAFSAELRLRSTTSKVVTDLLMPMNAEAAPEAFFRMSEDTSAAVFSPGGGPLPKWLQQVTDSDKSTPDAARARTDAASVTIAKLVGRPFAAAYGVHIDRAKAAVAAVRAAKDPAKEKKVLDKALDAYGTFALSIDLATVERTAREMLSAQVAVEAAKPKVTPPPHTASSSPPLPKSTQLVRIASAKYGLPKGSFFIDETKPDVSVLDALSSRVDGAKGKPTKVKMKVESTLFVADGAGTTWGFLGDDEKTLVESAKKVVAAPPVTKKALDPMLSQQGIVVGGYLSSLVGAFAMHSITSAFAAPGALNDDLAELEKDLSATRLPIPFVLTSNKRAEGGVVRFETKGTPEAFKGVGEHLGFATAGAAFLLYALVLAGP